VYSIITTASAPRGTMAPVAMAVAVPGSTGRDGMAPVGSFSGLSWSLRRRSSDAPKVSAARTAKPPMLARSNNGTSTGAPTAPARAQRCGERHCLGIERRQVQRGRKTPLRLVAIDHVEKLFLSNDISPRRSGPRAPVVLIFVDGNCPLRARLARNLLVVEIN